jgi:hypothetical protein
MNTKLSGHTQPQERRAIGTTVRSRPVLGLALLAAGCLAVLLACAPAYTRPLVSRGLPAEERKDYIIQNGYGIPENIKQAFLEGFVEVGMAKELVFQLYGTPDRTTGGDTNWEYVNNKGNLITGITFKADKVEKVYGDPKGGSTAQAQATP